MDIPGPTVPTVAIISSPPSYTEACGSTLNISEPGQPPTPPPSYGEAVGCPPYLSPYPILSVPTDVRAAHETQRVFAQPPPTLVGPLGDAPTVTICPHCRSNVTTVVQYKPGAMAWGMCCMLTLIGLVCGFCLIPFCLKGLQDVYHSCPACSRHLGIYIR